GDPVRRRRRDADGAARRLVGGRRVRAHGNRQHRVGGGVAVRVAAASTPATRVRNYGYYSLWNSAGAVVGPVIGGFVTGHFGYRTAFALVWLLMIPSFAIAGSLRGLPAVPGRTLSLATAHRLTGTILRQRGV